MLRELCRSNQHGTATEHPTSQSKLNAMSGAATELATATTTEPPATATELGIPSKATSAMLLQLQ